MACVPFGMYCAWSLLWLRMMEASGQMMRANMAAMGLTGVRYGAYLTPAEHAERAAHHQRERDLDKLPAFDAELHAPLLIAAE